MPLAGADPSAQVDGSLLPPPQELRMGDIIAQSASGAPKYGPQNPSREEYHSKQNLETLSPISRISLEDYQLEKIRT
ncbi:MAG TPA: hypothetical protein VED24_00370 [Candidatus Acidoferrum sp.]|nr:hypothetical protein [Candidatus Acidoferrum sp.]